MIILNKVTAIIDDVKKAVSATIRIKDQHIEKVYLVSSKIENCEALKVLDLENHIVIPHVLSEDDLQLMDLPLIYTNKLEDIQDGFYVFSSFNDLSENDVETLKNKAVIIHDLFYQTGPLSIEGFTLSNLALTEDTPYVYLNLDHDIHPMMVDLVLRNVPYNRLIVRSKNMVQAIQTLHFKYHVDLVDIVAYTSLNLARFLKLDYQFGTITRGKPANLLILNQDLELVYRIQDGVLYE